MKQLKSYSFDEIKNLFETTIRRVHIFALIESESEGVIPELTARSSKRDAEEELVQESSKRQKTGIVPEQGMNVEALQTKLYDSCVVHHVSTKDGMDIYMLVEREYPLSRGVLTQMLVAKLMVEQDSEMSRKLLRKIFMQVERPRR
ncbi:hypothetical protein Tco_1313021 [Tanacetum coccineum]